jgi:hypothetical protein
MNELPKDLARPRRSDTALVPVIILVGALLVLDAALLVFGLRLL